MKRADLWAGRNTDYPFPLEIPLTFTFNFYKRNSVNDTDFPFEILQISTSVQAQKPAGNDEVCPKYFQVRLDIYKWRCLQEPDHWEGVPKFSVFFNASVPLSLKKI